MRVPMPVSAIAGKMKRYLRDSSATTSAIFGIAAIPVFMGAGVAIDMSRANMEQTAFHAALDSAALAIAADDRSSTQGLSDSQITTREAELKVIAEDYVEANYKSDSFTAEITALDVQITGQDVTLTATAEFPTTIMGIFGIDSIDLDFLSRIKKAMKPIELVMVMDTTGSMASNGKLTGAKDAAHQLMNTLYSGSLASAPRSEYLRTALVPFSGAVRLNQSAYDFNLGWIDTTGVNPLSKLNFNQSIAAPAAWNNYYAWSQIKKSSSAYQSWNGCVEARMRGSAASGTDYNTNDAAPSISIPATLFPAYFSPDVPTMSSPGAGHNYITGTSLTAVGSECRGLTSTQCSGTTTTYLYNKQENYQKYIDKVVGVESTSTTGPWSNCTGSTIVPMTYDRAKVEAGIDAMVATGPTVIPEGLSWGWRAISPTEPFSKVEGSGGLAATTIAPYNDVRWQKILVLMTDGDNDVGPGSYYHNGSTYVSYGRQMETLATNRYGTLSTASIEPALDTAMSTICTNVKGNGVKVYVAAFGSGISTATKNLLKSCASGPEYYAEATTSADLTAFFDHIGEDVLSKSIYVAN